MVFNETGSVRSGFGPCWSEPRKLGSGETMGTKTGFVEVGSVGLVRDQRFKSQT